MFISETNNDCYETKYVKLGCNDRDKCGNLTLIDISWLHLKIKLKNPKTPFVTELHHLALYYCNCCNTGYALVQDENDSCTQMLKLVEVEVTANER